MCGLRNNRLKTNTMKQKMKSLLIGTAIAAFVIAPSVSGFGQTNAVHGASAPPAAPHGAYWAVTPARTFNASSVKLEDVVGSVIVKVRDTGPITLEIAGDPQRVNDVHASQDDGKLDIDGSSSPEADYSVWDWRNWFNFPRSLDRQSGNLTVTVTVARGTDVAIEDLVGDAAVGDTMGNLRLEAAVTKAHIGKVANAHISLGGSGRIDIASVQGALDLEMGGSGKVVAGSAGSVKADIAGSGDAELGPIAGGLSLDIVGSGDVTVAHVNGPVHLGIAGSGNVRIADGIADPLHVDIMGAGNLYFGGVAIDPHIDAVGSGTVHIKAYRGHLDSEGMADVKIGN
jgi:hypothetical protein